ncbi:hypothetical protein GGD83_001845 [Rhodoblastus sphagnicola]|nr:hypothetical protein [Rhodoblastus sphagnicola]MBB4198052.1 hypothetical protein [Rhodoblastus sphagnicola]
MQMNELILAAFQKLQKFAAVLDSNEISRVKKKDPVGSFAKSPARQRIHHGGLTAPPRLACECGDLARVIRGKRVDGFPRAISRLKIDHERMIEKGDSLAEEIGDDVALVADHGDAVDRQGLRHCFRLFDVNELVHTNILQIPRNASTLTRVEQSA